MPFVILFQWQYFAIIFDREHPRASGSAQDHRHLGWAAKPQSIHTNINCRCRQSIVSGSPRSGLKVILYRICLKLSISFNFFIHPQAGDPSDGINPRFQLFIATPSSGSVQKEIPPPSGLGRWVWGREGLVSLWRHGMAKFVPKKSTKLRITGPLRWESIGDTMFPLQNVSDKKRNIPCHDFVKKCLEHMHRPWDS